MPEPEGFRPRTIDEEILRVMLTGRDDNKPWGRASPGMIVESLNRDTSPEYVVNRLTMLNAAEFVRKRAKGVYEITEKGVERIEMLDSAAET